MAKNEFIKKAHQEVGYTVDQAESLWQCEDDPIYFAKNFVKVQHPKHGAIPFIMYPYQERAIEAFLNNRWSIIKCGRQMGKCVTGDTLVDIQVKPSGLKLQVLKWFFSGFGFMMPIETQAAIVAWCVSAETVTIRELHERLSPREVAIPGEDGELKFISEGRQAGLMVLSEDGYVDVIASRQTVEYHPWRLTLEDGYDLVCADHHLVSTDRGLLRVNELTFEDYVHTKTGPQRVLDVQATDDEPELMYDLEIGSDDHLYFTNGILSHNTTVISVYLLWYACFKEDKHVLVASKDSAGALDVMDRIRFAYEELPMWLKPGVTAYNRHSIEFDNGSSIRSVATTENTGRGKSLALLMIDELAFIKPSIQQAMWISLAPTLSTGGACIISSTPNGDSELFAQLWRQAVSGLETEVPTDADEEQVEEFYPIDVKWNEHPDRTETYRQTMIKKIGEEKFRQEYACEFLSSDPLLINTLTLSNIKEVEPFYVDKGFSFWKELSPHKTYLIGVDVAEGMGKDFSTIQLVELETLEQVAEFRNNKIKEDQLYDAIKYILTKLRGVQDPQTGKRPSVYWSFENNSAGAAIGVLYANDEKFPDWDTLELVNDKKDKSSRYGMRTTNKSKVEACRFLKKLVERVNGLNIKSKTLLFELKNYVATGASYAAKPGGTDDLVSAMLIVSRIVEYLSTFDDDAFDKLYRTSDDVTQSDGYNEYDDPIPFLV